MVGNFSIQTQAFKSLHDCQVNVRLPTRFQDRSRTDYCVSEDSTPVNNGVSRRETALIWSVIDMPGISQASSNTTSQKTPRINETNSADAKTERHPPPATRDASPNSTTKPRMQNQKIYPPPLNLLLQHPGTMNCTSNQNPSRNHFPKQFRTLKPDPNQPTTSSSSGTRFNKILMTSSSPRQ